MASYCLVCDFEDGYHRSRTAFILHNNESGSEIPVCARHAQAAEVILHQGGVDGLFADASLSSLAEVEEEQG